jgi:hypothetical protein
VTPAERRYHVQQLYERSSHIPAEVLRWFLILLDEGIDNPALWADEVARRGGPRPSTTEPMIRRLRDECYTSNWHTCDRRSPNDRQEKGYETR